MYYDIHCHLDALENISGAIESAREKDVSFILTNGLNPKNNRIALELEKEYSIVHAALGMYPTDAVTLSEQALQEELEFIAKKRPLAIGEIGIDYHHDATKKDEMKSVFEQCLTVAERIRRPVLVHSRKAEEDVLNFLESSSVTADLHCFGGSLKKAKKGVEMGCYFSIPTNIVRATQFQRLVNEVPIELLLTETDAPWLSPTDKPNEPANVPLVVNKIAELKQIDVDEAKHQLDTNRKLFLGNFQ